MHNKIKKILFVTLSNIGDCFLSLPVLDYLLENFPEAKITIVVGPRPKEIFENNPNISRMIVFDKHIKLREKLKLFKELKKEKFDLVIDLRNSFFGALLPAKFKTSPFLSLPSAIKHMKDKHLYRGLKVARSQGHPFDFAQGKQVTRSQGHKAEKKSIYVSKNDEEYINKILAGNNIRKEDKIIVIAPGARSHIKRWSQEKFAQLIPLLIEEFKARIVLVGDKDDAAITRQISQNCASPMLDLAGKTSLMQLAALLKLSKCIITNDSATLHLAGYLDVPTIAIFGATNEAKYGPWSEIKAVVKKDIYCRPCEKAQCKFGTLKCIEIIKVGDVLEQVRNILNLPPVTCHLPPIKYKRILIVRTDRIGDVLLSTPVIKTLRENYPHAYIAMMVSPYTKEIVEGNPYLDDVIIYDKDGKHKSWQRSIKFARSLRKKKFDLAIILHPINRVHLITFFAGIPKRIGYNRKMGFLLSDKLVHAKELGKKHELEYNLDLLSALGMKLIDTDLYMPIKSESEKWVNELFAREKILKSDRLLVIHPGASCSSKVWPQERFAEVADQLIDKYGCKALVISGPKDIFLAEKVSAAMHNRVINLGGKTSISQIASLFQRCNLLITNDSGPMHIAAAVGTPVIAIFGRAQAGLSPKRWGPRGKKSFILHKNTGCIECLAHNCLKGFLCLKAITVNEVVKLADSILQNK